ncbi:MAG TPA: type II CAAX endopeptidase family protein [Mycobacteriales bacterium]|nr:type II CAAX endopeptidase family protein [Mycobacteriales bacterium]
MGDALAGTALSLVVANVVAVVAFAVSHTPADRTDQIPLWAVALLEIPLWLVLVAWAWRTTVRKGVASFVQDFGLRMEWRDLPIGLVAGFAAQIVFAVVLLPLYDLLGIDRHDVGKVAQNLADRARSPVGVITLSIVVIAVAPVVEELFYRGLWLRAAERRWGTPAAVAVSAIVFGVIHFQPVDTIPLVLFGALAGGLVARYGRLGPAIWAHVAFNTTAVVSLLHK